MTLVSLEEEVTPSPAQQHVAEQRRQHTEGTGGGLAPTYFAVPRLTRIRDFKPAIESFGGK
uniref:AlNc14C43G3604 protein n=1 Tax=Albugo laibachii Nc14 TaxID=890382 RepID=F0WA60_9STRA|nr:AlNc14C43G3604 [Albugo laibachii Nc14]|eukprot:CCA18030.1 AlNc14C43G3604 [Albugo laibachii Nc14]